MNAKILCTWLGLPDQSWPPDHYTLLGLKPGEGDLAHIEKQVQECMARLRCYQLSHPEEATEGMNRIAQAFICLTEIHTRKAFEQAPAQSDSGAIRNGQGTKSGSDPAAETSTGLATAKTEVDWSSTPPPVRGAKDKSSSNVQAATVAPLPPAPAPAAATPAPPTSPPANPEAASAAVPSGTAATAAAATAATPAAATPAAATPAVAPPAPVDPIFEIARSLEARRGLATLPALIERVNLTRKLLIAWKQAGRYLGAPRRRLTRQAEEIDLTRRLSKIHGLLAQFPPILGQPGQPGYRVVAMARLDMTAQMFKMMDEAQRKVLAQDWNAACNVLLAHRRFLRGQFKALRRQGVLRALLRAIRGAINDHPLGVVVGFLLAVAISVVCYVYVF